MSDGNKGGPAFPTPVAMQHNDGMSLRDYFAAAALTGLLVNGSDYPFELSAEDAYKLADRMLEARGGQQ